MIVKVVLELCDGGGLCESVAEGLFKMAGDVAITVVDNIKDSRKASAEETGLSCSSGAIVVEQVYS